MTSIKKNIQKIIKNNQKWIQRQEMYIRDEVGLVIGSLITFTPPVTIWYKELTPHYICSLDQNMQILEISPAFAGDWFRKLDISQFSSIQFSCSVVSDSVTPWNAACQGSLSITNSLSLLKLMSVESVMPSNHIILCHPLLLLPSVYPSIRVFSNESILRIRWPKY